MIVHNSKQQHNRIKILDGFRCIAIMFVVVFHYFSRWTPPADVNLYPYEGRFKNALFDEGGNGVQFFFIISGFVIYFTLQRSKNIFEFLYRRFVRLWPTLLLCSCLTFLIIKLLDNNGYFGQQTRFLNFIPSLLFVEPATLKQYFNLNSGFMDGAYWSLVVEVKFYIIIALVYFILPAIPFLKKWSFFFVSILLLHLINKKFHLNYNFNSVVEFLESLLVYNYLWYFTFGIFCFEYVLKKKVSLYFIIPVFIVFRTVFLLHVSVTAAVLFALFFALFIIFITKPKLLGFLELPLIQRMGVISYAIYLLHQNIGVILINRLMVSHNILFMALVTLIVFFIIGSLAELITRYYEPLAKKLLFRLPWFKNLMNSSQNNLQLQ